MLRRSFNVSPRLRFVLFIAFLSLVAGVATCAADDTGTVRGTTTTQGRTVFLAGVAVVLTDASGVRQPLTTASDDSGHFTLTGVIAGQYRLRASLVGFDDATQVVQVLPGGAVDVALDLAVAKVSEKVDVVERASDLAVKAANSTDRISGEMMNRAPVADNYQALLPLLPGVIRGPDGRIRMSGGEPTQSGLQVSSASVTDPSTGDFALELPADAVESVEAVKNAYSVEYGRFSSGVTRIETRKGGDRWQVIPNSFFPRLQTEAGQWPSLRGIGSFTPRVSIGGPLIKDRLFLSENLQYRLVRSDVASLPGDPNTELRSFDSYTRLDATLDPGHRITAALAVYPRRIHGVNLSTFTPPAATATFHQSGFNVGLSDSLILWSAGVLETTVNIKHYDVNIAGRGTEPIQLTTEGVRGNYFNQQTRATQTFQAVSAFTSALHAFGEHVLKVGADVLSASYSGTSTSDPVEILRQDGTLSERVTFNGTTRQSVAGTDVSVFAQDKWRPVERVQVEFGTRLDRNGVLEHVNVSPRSGFTLALRSDSRAVLRGGFGVFYQRTPLSVGAFDSMDTRTIAQYGGDGITPLGPPTRVVNTTFPLQTPFALVGNVELDGRIGERWLAKANVLHRAGSHEFIIVPLLAPAAVLQLESTGRSDYWEGELTARYQRSARTDLTMSYVRSRAEANLNNFDSYFGNFRLPHVWPDQYSLTGTDVPHRFVVRGTLPLPDKWQVAPVVELRSGFPYTLIDQNQAIVGIRNQGGRFPLVKTVDLSLDRPFKIHGVRVRAGFRSFNVLNQFNPRDVQNNVASPAFGGFYNPIPRSFGLNFWIDR